LGDVESARHHQHELRRTLDPILALALKKSYEKGAILIAAVGNQGRNRRRSIGGRQARDRRHPRSTKTISSTRLECRRAVAVRGPGVDVMVPAPSDAYQLTTGHVGRRRACERGCGAAARAPPAGRCRDDPRSADLQRTRLGANKRDDKLGWGLVDPLAAPRRTDARLTDAKVAAPATVPCGPSGRRPGAATAAPTPPRRLQDDRRSRGRHLRSKQ